MTQAAENTVVIDGSVYPVVGPVKVNNLATFPPKVVTGDFQKESDPLLSSWVLDDFSGGGQVEIITPGDTGRYWFGSCDPRWPNQLALAPLTAAASNGATAATPVGDLAGVFYAAFDNTIAPVNGATIGSTTALANGQPVNISVVFKGKLYLPYGSAGYSTWDGTTVASFTTAKPNALALWDNKLFAFNSDGTFFYTIDGTNWTDTTLTVDTSRTPRHLLTFYNRIGDPTLHLVTDLDVWAYDASVPQLYLTSITQMPHPDMALGAFTWRNEIFLSAGVGVYRYTGGTISGTGLDRDNGLPAAYRGKIVDLRGDLNNLYALVQGTTAVGSGSEAFVSDRGPYDDALYFNQGTTNASLAAWTETGWHVLWTADGLSGTPTRLCVSRANSTYTLYWGFAGNVYSMPIQRDYASPRALIVSGTGSFAPSGYLELGEFDAAMAGYTKLASEVVVRCRSATATETVTVKYSLDSGVTWTTLGVVGTTTKTSLPFGYNPATNQNEGTPFVRMRLRFELARDPNNTTVTPLVDYVVLYFQKIPKTAHSFTFQLPLASETGWYGLDYQTAIDNLDRLAGMKDSQGTTQTPKFFNFVHRATTYRCRVAQVVGADPTGQLIENASRQVTLIEVPLGQ